MKKCSQQFGGLQNALMGVCLTFFAGLAAAEEPIDSAVVFASDGEPHVLEEASPTSADTPSTPGPLEATPMTEMLFGPGSTLRVADAVSRLAAPNHFFIAKINEVEQPVAPVVAPVAALQSDASPLNRPIVALTLDSAADPKLTSQMANLSDEFAINDTSLDRFGDWNAPHYEATMAPARYGCRTAAWAAPAVYSRPLYFEQPNLERYGHHVAVCEKDCLTQSALSAAHFFATVPVLPYKMGAEHPDECSYVLGHYRPGSCNPHQLQRPQWSLRGLAYEGLVVTGLVFLIP